jgi:hypothetical protein
MIPLLENLIKSDDEKQVLGMILHQFYWKAFTGNDAAVLPDSTTAQEPGQPEPEAG